MLCSFAILLILSNSHACPNKLTDRTAFVFLLISLAICLGFMLNVCGSTLSAYTADEGDFEEVMRAYIAELNTKIELLQIDVARLRVISRLNYLLARSEPEKE